MTHEELLHIAQAFAYLELKIDKIVPDSPDRSAAISLLEQGKLPWIPAIALGIVFGLSACGLYDTAKNVIPNLTNPFKPAISGSDPSRTG